MSNYAKLTLPNGNEYFLVPPEDVEKIGKVEELEDEIVNLHNELDLKIRDYGIAKQIIEDVYGHVKIFVDTEPEEGDTIIVNLGESIQSAIDRAEKGDTVLLKEGVHFLQTMDFSGKEGITVKGEGDVLINNMQGYAGQWWQDEILENVFITSFGQLPNGLWHFKGSHEGDAFNNRLMFPLLCAIGDDPLIYNPDGALPLSPGQFYYSGETGDLYVYPKEGQSMDEFNYCRYPRIVWGDENSKDITMENITFKGCSNTGKTGAISTPGSLWTLEKVRVDLVNTIGVELGQGGERSDMRSQVKDSEYIDVVVTRAGQMGWWGSAFKCHFNGCGHYGSNWRGFDHWWEASHKFENMHDCYFDSWHASSCKGPGFWLDGVRGGNTNIILDNFDIDNCERAGIDLELNTSYCTINDPSILGIKPTSYDPEKNWKVSYGIGFKAGCVSNKVTGGYIESVEDAIRLDNDDTRTEPCTGNSASGLKVSNIEKLKVKVLGELLDNVFDISDK